ncbi:UDP-2,4-diacetamido-2,4,6-trideoxy-beta-L-altropyranose hydrolase [Stutzerimonas nitrititolerans]|uniref:UDP-2,4-diacetamido-2,4, 6-trideoxy-beta-L-altropyranose hydrolase n=1 Tax=Stutzerimonas nitrititolerans TaxID=2482751 RepID=UPI00289F77E4|nr:UDP-2,4-diacetamido-2,4,6-trideoxy-beta-L-altropyranose hydrolase [Stutzerimonas nitrititolerans]
MGLKVCFRADASLQIGTGHVMRCLTLADALRELGAECRFICREHPGNLIELIRSKGYVVYGLPCLATRDAGASSPAHAAWLGSSQLDDAAASVACLAEWSVDWLIVDHYALDARWEELLQPRCRQLMVIDDLADRPHRCDLLLDQTLGRVTADYSALVPAHCELLCGSRFAMLRPEFAGLRDYSLQRRAHAPLQHLLITMGGVDKDNATGLVLDALRDSPLPAECRITVVMGGTAPWLATVREQAKDMPWLTTVRVGVSDMARLMADSDLAIGAAGATSWERCCLGLPAIMLILASNQRMVARGLELAGAVRILHSIEQLDKQLPRHLHELINCPAHMSGMSRNASAVVDGSGLAMVTQHLGL